MMIGIIFVIHVMIGTKSFTKKTHGLIYLHLQIYTEQHKSSTFILISSKLIHDIRYSILSLDKSNFYIYTMSVVIGNQRAVSDTSTHQMAALAFQPVPL